MGEAAMLFEETVRNHRARYETDAERHCALVLLDRPENPQALRLMAALHVQWGQWESAIDLLRRSLVLAPDHVPSLNSLGFTLRKAGRLAEAATYYEISLALEPDVPDMLNNLGLVWRDLGAAEQAVACFRQAIALLPDHGMAHGNLGFCLMASGDAALASFHLARAAGLLRDKGWVCDALNNLGVALRESGRLDEAATAYERLLEAAPDFADGFSNYGLVLAAQGWPAEAAEAYRQAIRLRPDHAHAHNNLGIVLWSVGLRTEAAECYATAIAIDPTYAHALKNLASIRYREGDLTQAIAYFERAITASPDYYQAINDLGVTQHEAGAPGKAYLCYERAIEVKPDFQPALTNLGNLSRELHQFEDALNYYERALAIAPDDLKTLNNKGVTLRDLGRLDEAVAIYRHILSIVPDHMDAAGNLGMALIDLGQVEAGLAIYRDLLERAPDNYLLHNNLAVGLQLQARYVEAAAAFNRALALKPDDPDTVWNRSHVLLALGRYREGWADYESGLGQMSGRGLLPFCAKRWDGGPIAGQRLLIYCEQGFGDALQFIRYASLCKQRGATVFVMCRAPLEPLFAACPYIDRVAVHFEVEAFDYQVSMMSLPHLFQTELDTVPGMVPYLRATPQAIRRWMPMLEGKGRLKVGIAWAGDPRPHQPGANRIDRRRSMPLSALAPLLDIPGIDFFSLQKNAASEQIDALGLRERITDLMPMVDDFMDTAAIIEQLDLVIAVDTSTVHLAGALGKPVWVLSRFDACWRWLGNRETSPWYPSARVFGQSAPSRWDDVVARVGAALKALVPPPS